MINYKIKLNFIRKILGSQPANEDLKKSYITKKMMTGKTGMSAEIAMDKVEDEISNLNNDERIKNVIEEIDSKSLTVFFRDKEKRIGISDIQLRGFIKDNFAFVGRNSKWITKRKGEDFFTDAPFRDFIGSRIMFKQDLFPFEIQPEKIEIFQRPIRVQTMLGPRVSITASESIEPPNSITIEFATTDDIKEEWIPKIFDRGIFRGLGQFSNAQFGSFQYEILDVVKE
jgi:hypothetical protein